MKQKPKPLKLDPVGYFIIRVSNRKIEIGFCKYEDMVLGRSNKVLKRFSSQSPEKIIAWIKKNRLYSQESHLNYIKKELERAKRCIENNKIYVQS